MIETPEKLAELASQLKGKRQAATKVRIHVSMGTCGIAAGTRPVLEAIRQEVHKRGLEGHTEVVETGCMGLCHSEPSVEVVDVATGASAFYGKVEPRDAAALLDAGTAPPPGLTVVPRTWYYPEDEANVQGFKQARIVLRNSGRVNPEDINEYIACDGYQALAKVLGGMSPVDTVELIKRAGLRGRGGGGFPTGQKWEFAAKQAKAVKYVVCNADEGDPGAFMDRAVLEGDPHSVLEAMVIAGYAVGAGAGVVYIRAEYPLAVKRLHTALGQARGLGLLGKNILNSGFDFDIELKYGAGAFVCGEETALIHSVEGHRGEPSFKPPFPAVEGLWKAPTIVNNVETYACVCAIVRKGADWFRSVGTEKCPGTKVFALAGKINKVGLAEVPMGTPLRDIIFGIGQGIKNGRAFKAVQTGGPSGGCITTKHLDTPIDYESLRALGSMMGSGGMIVMDEDDCMVNIARFFLEFTLDESCGKCTPCRIGNKRLHEMLVSICDGKGERETMQKLKTLALTIKDTALCGLGQTSPNPVLSTLANFEDEYLAHIDHRKCPAGVCVSLISYNITEACVGCTLCARSCPVSCISGERKARHLIDQSRCIKCGVCYNACKFHAIEKR